MNRVLNCRKIRTRKRKFIFAIIFVIFLSFTGMFMADISVNGLLTNKKGIEIISVANEGDSIYSVTVMNIKMNINTSNIKNDYHNMKNHVTQLIDSLLKKFQ